MMNDVFVLDAVTHAFNFAPENWYHLEHARAITDMSVAVVGDAPSPEYALTRAAIAREWPVEDTTSMLFRESRTDVAVFHPLPITAFRDGMCGIDKAVTALEKWPNRYIGAYACMDPIRGTDAFPSLEEQVEALNPLGLKLYPSSWSNDSVSLWRMDDPKVAFPVFERAAELGIKHVAVHKSIPLGPAYAGNAFHPGDVEGAAAAFPEINFEIVHGGIAFTEETAWMLARYDNISINMENLNIILARRPRTFAKILLGMMHVGGNGMLDKMFWGTGTMQYHPRPCLDAFMDFEFPEDLLESAGLFAPLSQITAEQKAGMLGLNYARKHGLDVEKMKAAIAGDEFSKIQAGPLPAPYSTTTIADQAGAAALAATS